MTEGSCRNLQNRDTKLGICPVPQIPYDTKRDRCLKEFTRSRR